MNEVKAIGIDIGGTKISAAVVSSDGSLTMKRTEPTPDTAAKIIERSINIARPLFGVARTAPVAVGVGAAGVISPDGVVESATDILPGWSGTSIGASLSAALQASVSVLNDAHAAAVGEMFAGAGVGASSGLTLTLGTGVGGAFFADQVLVRGATGTAGSIGHIQVGIKRNVRCSCGGYDHLECFASGTAISRMYRESTGRTIPVEDIGARCDTGEAAANAVIMEAGKILGTALASLTSVLDPEIVIIGGGVAALGDRLLLPVRQQYRIAALPGPARTPIVGARLGSWAGVVGAALHAATR